MNHFARLAGAMLCLAWHGSLLAAPASLPQPADLRIEARLVQRTSQPLIVLFSLPGCPYCKEVRENYLAPMIRDARTNQPVIIREVDITSHARLKGFNGELLTQAQFASHYKVGVTPTVVMLDATGAPLAEPLIGAGMAGFYGAYLDNALEKSRQKLQARNRPATPGKAP